MSFIKEFWEFLRLRKKYWLLPIDLISSFVWWFNCFNSRFCCSAFIFIQFSKVISILGISAFYHDSAACILKDGKIIAAAQEERFTRIKHDASYPKNAIEFVLDYAKLNLKVKLIKFSFF